MALLSGTDTHLGIKRYGFSSDSQSSVGKIVPLGMEVKDLAVGFLM